VVDIPAMGRLASLSERLARCSDLDTLVSTTLASRAELFGYEHSLLLLVDEREAPIRIEKTGRGRFRLVVEREVRLECVEIDE
jgi:hypothetical protein